MNDTQTTNPQVSFVTIVDTAAKAVAVLVAVSLLFGVTFNIAFFLATKREWLFRVSVADNITATFYALPVVVIVAAVGAGLSILVGEFLRATRLRSATIRWQLPYVFIAVLMPLVAMAVIAWRSGDVDVVTFVATVLVCYLTFGAALIIQSPWEITNRVAPLLGLLVLISLTGVVVLAIGSSRRDRPSVEVDLIDTGTTHAILSGQIVRILDSGLILKQGKAWVWLPREQIRRVTEISP